MGDLWKYRKKKNMYGYEQLFDCSKSPTIPVCNDCHKPDVLMSCKGYCRHCDEMLNLSDDAHRHIAGLDPLFVDETNEHGFLQTYQIDGDKKIAVCPQCHAMVMPNRGQGTMCDDCIHEDIMECKHNDMFF